MGIRLKHKIGKLLYCYIFNTKHIRYKKIPSFVSHKMIIGKFLMPLSI